MKTLVLFLATFVVGAALALGTRTVLHQPHGAYTPSPVAAPVAAPHAGHAHSGVAPLADAKPVNTICAICGMDVDSSVKPASYQGKLVGFGCGACPPKFAKDPDRYGPSALRNEVAPR